MEKKMISLSRLERVMRPKELKNILGGSGGGICDKYGPDLCLARCKNGNLRCTRDCDTVCDDMGGIDTEHGCICE